MPHRHRDKIRPTEAISAELIELRSLSPYDWDVIAASVKRTGKVIGADTAPGDYMAEIAARIAEELFDHLAAPVKRVGPRPFVG